MLAIIEALANGASTASDAPLHEIIELRKKALREKQANELAFDLCGLDGVRLPLQATRLPVHGTQWRMMLFRWFGRFRDR